ncbi:MAG: acyltransferase family protein [Gemmatimonadales bacterium]
MTAVSIPKRLASLDFLRGLIMVLLMLESAQLYARLLEFEGTPLYGLALQFHHHPWHGLRFWDLIQPGFMFIAGAALALSLDRQSAAGLPWAASFRKALKRSGWLFFWGVLDYAVRPQGLSFELWDVLTQLSFTSLVAFLIFRWPVGWQIGVSIGLLVATEALYRLAGVAGFDQAFTDQRSFGNYVDLLLMNKINPDGWVAINCLPTAAHTIWGALAARLLLSSRSSAEKIRWLVVAGAVALVAGFGLDLTTTPIIKRIATSSFVLASGGFCLLGLAACYWAIDVRHRRPALMFFTVVGMNSLFIYLFFEIIGNRWFTGYVGAITNGLMGMAGVPGPAMGILTALAVFGLEWGLCYFLYRRGIFFKV